MNKKTSKLTEGEKFGQCAGMLLWIIQGLRNRSISSKPILNMESGAKEYPMTSLEDSIWGVLNKCGITEKVKAPVEKVKKPRKTAESHPQEANP